MRTRFDSVARWLHRLGATTAAVRIGSRRLTTLCYHGVAPYLPGADRFAVKAHLDCDLFRRQLAWLGTHMRFVDLETVLGAIDRGHRLPKRAVLLTFDDAFLNNLTYALPILKEYGARPVFFVPSEPLNMPGRKLWYSRLAWVASLATESTLRVPGGDSGAGWSVQSIKDRWATSDRLFELVSSWDAARRDNFISELEVINPMSAASKEAEAYFFSHMSWEQLRGIAGSEVDVGGHTATHAALSHVDESEARREVAENYETLRDRLGVAPIVFAYPFGSRSFCGPREEAIVRDAGYSAAFTLVPPYMEGDANRFALPRRNVAPVCFEMFTFLISRLSDLPMRFRER